MDQSFLLRARRLLEQRPLARLAYGELLAAAARQRDSSPTARLAGASERAAAAPEGLGALTNLLLNGNADAPGTTQIGIACFNRAVATRPVKVR